jgi:sensor histidine kinase YesM
LSQSIQEGFVQCLLSIEDNVLDFTLQNSKTEERDERYFQGGIGLTNVKRRLELIYPKRYELDIEQNQEIYLVNLKIKLN